MCLYALFAAHSAFASVPTAYFAGFAFIGDDAAVVMSYPYTSALVAEQSGNVSVLDESLRRQAHRVTNSTFSLEFEQLASLKPGVDSAVVVAFALDRETVSVEQIGGEFKLLIELSAQALFVDFREMAVIASYPIVIQYIDVKSSRPSREAIAEAVRDLYLGESGHSIFDAFTTTLQGVQLNPAVARRIRVTQVTIEESARSILDPSGATHPGLVEAALAQDFSKFLSANQNVPVLPPAKGQAIGNRMATRFSDGRVYSLKIPEADYSIDLRLEELRRVEYAKTSAGQSLVYGAFMHILVQEPLSGTTYFDAKLRNGATKLVPASQKNIDDAAAFEDAVLALIDKFTRSIGTADAAWAEKYAGDRKVAGQMKTLEKVLQSCR